MAVNHFHFYYEQDNNLFICLTDLGVQSDLDIILIPAFNDSKYYAY